MGDREGPLLLARANRKFLGRGRHRAALAQPARIRLTAAEKASANVSMSFASDAHPRLTRTAPCARLGSTPIAARTWDGVTLPEEQADPELTATPARSRPIIKVAAATPGTAK